MRDGGVFRSREQVVRTPSAVPSIATIPPDRALSG
jgi:hypothetical protein